MYDMKALYEAESVENAVALRLEHPEAQIIAGGSDVLVQMREGKRAGKELISIYGLDELRGVSIDEEENIRIGSLSSFSHITRDPIIQKYINVLGEAVEGAVAGTVVGKRVGVDPRAVDVAEQVVGGADHGGERGRIDAGSTGPVGLIAVAHDSTL